MDAHDDGSVTIAAPALPGWPAAMPKPLAAAYVQMSERWIDAAVAAGDFPRPLKFGRAARWPRAVLDEWLAAKLSAAVGRPGPGRPVGNR